MLTTQFPRLLHCGWSIELVQEQDEFYFECYLPNANHSCSNGAAYLSQEAASSAACEFVEREIAVLALIDLANGWWEQGVISEAEYWQLTDFA
jgi:hypothetical protein